MRSEPQRSRSFDDDDDDEPMESAAAFMKRARTSCLERKQSRISLMSIVGLETEEEKRRRIRLAGGKVTYCFGLVKGRDPVEAALEEWRRRILEEGIVPEVEHPCEDEPLKVDIPYVDKPLFNYLIGLVICTNAAVIGIELQHEADGAGKNVPWEFFNLVFLVIYTAEVSTRIYFHRWGFFDQPGMVYWNWFDLALVLSNWFETIVVHWIGLAFAAGGVSVMTIIRFARLERLLRLIKLVRSMKELRLTFQGLIQSIRIYIWICLLVLVILYIAAIPVTDMVGSAMDLYEPAYKEFRFSYLKYFSNLSKTVLTLFQLVTMDDGIDSIARPVQAKQPGVSMVITVFTFFMSFQVFNIMVSVVVDAVLDASQKAKDMDNRDTMKFENAVFEELEDFFHGTDKDGSGAIDLEELKEALLRPEVYKRMQMIDFPVEDVDRVFKVLDYDDSGDLNTDEFLTGCIRLRGFAKNKDIVAAQIIVDRMAEYLEIFRKELDLLGGKIDELAATASAIMTQSEQCFLPVQEYRERHKKTMHYRQRMPTIRCTQLDLMPWEMPSVKREMNRVRKEALIGKVVTGQPVDDSDTDDEADDGDRILQFDEDDDDGDDDDEWQEEELIASLEEFFGLPPDESIAPPRKTQVPLPMGKTSEMDLDELDDADDEDDAEIERTKLFEEEGEKKETEFDTLINKRYSQVDLHKKAESHVSVILTVPTSQMS
jgi:voltage-gated sodium channel